MTAALLDAANDDIRQAVEHRLEAQAAGVPHDQWYDQIKAKGGATADDIIERFAADGGSCCEGQRQPKAFYGAPKSSGSAEWLAALERLRALHYEKTAQYGGADDAFENVTASARCGVEPWRRALCDLSDCVVRMQKFAQGQPVDATNALLDAANWALICLIKMQEAGRA